MKFKIFDKIVYLYKTNVQLETDVCFQVQTTYHSVEFYLINFVKSFINSFEAKKVYIIYSEKCDFLHTFESGIHIEVKMIIGKTFRTNKHQHEIDEFFIKRLKPLLHGRMSEKYINIYLDSLRSSLITRNDTVDNIIWSNNLNIEIPNDEYDLELIFDCVSKLDGMKINKILNIITQNELNYSLSSNVFNLHKTEPQQQNALNYKSIQTKKNNDDDLCTDYKYTNNLANEILINGKTYVCSNGEFVFIDTFMRYDKLIRLLKTGNIFGFIVEENNISYVKVGLCIRKDFFNKFRKRKNSGELIQFSMRGETIEDVDIKFYKRICVGVWQSGDSKLLSLDYFSEETLLTTTKTFNLYGIFCKAILTKFINETECSVLIKNVIKFGQFEFIYANCMLKNESKSIAFKIYNEYHVPCTHCISPQMINNQLDLMWASRLCFMVIYHTYFPWINEALADGVNISNEIINAATRNIINYKYIKDTGNIDITPRNQQDSITMVQITIETFRNVYRDMFEDEKIKPNGHVRFSQFDGSKDGPLVSAVSIRACEKLTTPSIMDKEWKVNVLNLSSILNVPNFKCTESMNNKITF